jgi:hypothetical protein
MMEFVNWDHDIPNIWKMFQTTNQLLWFWSRDLPHLPSRPVPPPLPRLQLQGPFARPLEFHRAHHAQVEANLDASNGLV